GVVGPALSRLCETENRAVPTTPSPLDTTCHPGNLGYGTASPIAPCIPPRAQHGIARPSSTKPRTAEPAKPDFLSAGQGGRVGARLTGAIWRDIRLVRAIWRDVRLIGAVRKYVRLARAEPFTESPT